MPLIDKQGRHIEYLRLSVTDRCNLRCTYCMPENITFVKKDLLLSFEEMERLVRILVKHGLKKVRITGGEPFARHELPIFLNKLSEIKELKKISLTTNGVLTEQYLEQLQNMGIYDVNLSLDTLNKEKFHEITKRDEFEKVWRTFEKMVEMDFNVKINCVVMEGINTDEIIPMVELTEKMPVNVRFIEEMPFDGKGGRLKQLTWDHLRILNHVKANFEEIISLPQKTGSTSQNFSIEGNEGNFGIIAAHTRSFCGSCNRIRISPTGKLRTCLYGHNVLDLRALLRSNYGDLEIVEAIQMQLAGRAKDGFEAEEIRKMREGNSAESMSEIGG